MRPIASESKSLPCRYRAAVATAAAAAVAVERDLDPAMMMMGVIMEKPEM